MGTPIVFARNAEVFVNGVADVAVVVVFVFIVVDGVFVDVVVAVAVISAPRCAVWFSPFFLVRCASASEM